MTNLLPLTPPWFLKPTHNPQRRWVWITDKPQPAEHHSLASFYTLQAHQGSSHMQLSLYTVLKTLGGTNNILEQIFFYFIFHQKHLNLPWENTVSVQGKIEIKFRILRTLFNLIHTAANYLFPLLLFLQDQRSKEFLANIFWTSDCIPWWINHNDNLVA